MDFALWELMDAGDPQDEVVAVIRLNPSVALPPDVKVVSVLGNIVTCRVPRCAIQRIWSDDAIASFKAARVLLPEDDIAPDHLPPLPQGMPMREDTLATLSTDQRRPPGIPETGQNVILGFIDWGFDFAHPDFRKPDGTSRILALWDQRTVPGKAPPLPYGYGIVHTQADINRALNTANPYKALGYGASDSDPGGDGSHATHVASIAAGNGQAGGPIGMAPQADLVFVHMTTLNAPGQEKLGDSVSLLEAIDFIFKLAGNQPCVINLSLGRHGEQHDGTTLVEQAFDNLLNEAPGRAIIQSSGNYYSRNIHTAGQVRPGETLTFEWLIHQSDQTPNQLEVWYSGRDVFEVEVSSPAGDIVCRVALGGKREDLVHQGKLIGHVYHRKLEPNNHDNHITVYQYAPAPAGAWKISLIARDIIDGRFHSWIERDWGSSNNQSTFSNDDATSVCTTGTICNGCRTIAVGAYNPHSHRMEIASFSSAGPTRDGRLKPDLVAPGVHILAARSAPNDNPSLNRPLLVRKSGTSMAAPHVAGAVALIFEAAGRPLHIGETHKLLLGSTQWNPDLEEERHRFGSGYLDIESALDAARHVRQSPTRRLIKEEETPMERIKEFAYAQSSPERYAQEDITTSELEVDSDMLTLSGSGSEIKPETQSKPIELDIGDEKRYLLKADPDTGAKWSYTLSGETDSLLVSLDDLPLPPGASDEDGVYQLLTITALSSGKARIILTAQEKGQSATSKKIVSIIVRPEAGTNGTATKKLQTGTSRKKTSSEEEPWEFEDHEWQPWISREDEPSERESELIEALTQRIEAMETAVFSSPSQQQAPYAQEPYAREAYTTTAVIPESPEFTQFVPYAPYRENEAVPLAITDIADQLIESGQASGSSEALIRQALSEANVPIWLPSPAELFDTFAAGGTPALHQYVGELYEVVGFPGAPLVKPIQEGDILIRRALGEGSLAHAALVDAADLLSREQLLQEGLTPESNTSGWYTRVLEGGFLPHSRAQGYARRVLDWNGRVMPGQLILRPLMELATEAEPVNRKSRDYIRWIQMSLNKILGLNLSVDGLSGPKTSQAIRTFQLQKGLAPDGVVGPKTEQALIGAGASPPPGASLGTSGIVPPEVQKLCQGTPTVLDEFLLDQATLTAGHQTILNGLAQKIVQAQNTATPITSVCLVGHTDSSGTEQHNLDLGLRRANAALKALTTAIETLKPGLSSNLEFRALSLAATTPVADDKTEQGRARNRRVSVFLNEIAKPKPTVCFSPPVSKDDPTALSVALAGFQDFSAGTATILGSSFKVQGRVFYPAESAGKDKPFNKQVAAKGPVPIVFLAHGNHSVFSDPKNRKNEECSNPGGFITIPNHLGYVYFQEMLAKMGIISVSVDCNETNCKGGSPTNIRQRAGLILEAIKHFRARHKNKKDVHFGGHIDFSKTGLFGHSRGAEAVLVVPELLGARPSGISDVLIQGVISLAPTDNEASTGIPNGYPLMVILPAGDGDVVTNDGAKYYDQAVPSPFKCQLYIHHTNHNFFNREWVNDEKHGPTVMNNGQHERLLSVYGAAFYRNTLLGQPFRRFLRQDELPPATPTDEVHISYEEKGPLTIDDHENRNIALNTLSQPTQQSGGLIAAEFDFSFTGSATFNRSFFGKTVGMVAQTSSAAGDYKSDLGSAMDFTGKELWVRAAEVYDGTSVPATGTGFQIGLEDTSGKIALVDSNASAGGLPRPYDRKADDLALTGVDLTKTMLTTFRFPNTCFTNALSGFDITKVTAVHIKLNRNDKRALAFDQLQIV